MSIDRKKTKTNGSSNRNKSKSWIMVLVAATIVLSISMSTASSVMIQNINLFVAVIVLMLIILLGIVLDIVGIAVAAADDTPFHAMASSKVKGAKNAIRLVKNASKVTTFCNDVVGDVCGVVSGSTSAFIVLKLSQYFSVIDVALLGIIISAMVAGMTVMGKAMGKTVAISKSNQIVYKVALLQYYIFNRFNLKRILERRVDRSE